MTESSLASLCRITIRVPGKSLDLAVPSDVPVVDLLPTVLRYAVADDLQERALDHGGWVLQVLGGAPLNDEGTLETQDIKDGDVLLLRPRSEALPEVRLDDLVDGIAGVTRERLHGWTPTASRALLRALIALIVLAGLITLALPGGSSAYRMVAAAAAGLLLLAGAGSASRAVGDAATGATLGFLVAPAFALAAWLLPGGDLTGPGAAHVLGARMLAAGAMGAGGSLLALAAVAVYTPFYFTAALISVAAAVAGALMSLLSMAIDDAFGVVAVLLVAVGGFVPVLAFKLAGMRMPSLPTSAQQLQEDIEPYEGGEVATRAELASVWMIALYSATGAICAGCLAALTHHPNLPEGLFAAALMLLLLLHGWGMVNVWQRLALVVPGVLGALLMVLGTAVSYHAAERPALVALLFALAAVLAIASWTVPGRRMVPYWGRAAELLHSGLAIGLLPLALWTLGVFGYLRGLAG
ncbi:type VII secretion integral membrane protein EccD [Streptomyces sp. NPDC059215]|uniref:type VII secretion integral membrane protein EccD n=1 Tax=Streptomyces sp. NPDC059215 TaxID=3346772 RepID=UPI0036A4717A